MKKPSIIIILLFMCGAVFADGTPAEGTGTETDPYLIESLDNLLWLSTTNTIWTSNKHFLQTEDINASDTQLWNDGKGLSPIGLTRSQPFCGNYNGNGHVIDSLYIIRPAECDPGAIGFMGYTNGAEIKKLGFTNVNITGDIVAAGLIGEMVNSRIDSCYVTGWVSCVRYVGGIVGLTRDSQISNSFADCTLTGSIAEASTMAEIVAWNSDSSIIGCYANGSIFGTGYDLGAITGRNNSIIQGSYYNYETFLINNQHWITVGALTEELFNAWISNNFEFDINDYLVYDGEYYLLSDYDDLEKLLIFGQNPDYSYQLTTDISLEDNQNFHIPIFTGSLNGNYYRISDSYVIAPEQSEIGLFGYVIDAEIEALGITNAYFSGFRQVGCLAGSVINSEIRECYANGTVTGTFYNIGGLTGYSENSNISKCSTRINVSGTGSHVGGLVGKTLYSEISQSYVTGIVGGYAQIGGIIGLHGSYDLHESNLNNSYMSGTLNGTHILGGLVGYNYSTISSSVWNTESTGILEATGYEEGGSSIDLLGVDTSQMQIMETYTDLGWDFVGESANGIDEIWNIEEDNNQGFPYINDIQYPVSNNEVLESVNTLRVCPNPFNPLINIYFEIAKDGNVQINIYNFKGQKVETLSDSYYKAGKHSLIWNANGKASGIYFMKFITNTNSEIRKITLLK